MHIHRARPGQTEVYLPVFVQEVIAEVAREGHPAETCGVLLGRHESPKTSIARSHAAKNLNRERSGDRYELDPRDLLGADEEARREGLEIVGIWHSHPDHPACPSSTDLDGAWPGYSYLIVSVSTSGIGDVRCWRLEGGDERVFIEERLIRS